MFEDLIDNMDVDDEVNNEVSKEEVIVDKINDERCINTIVDNILNKYGSFIEDDNEKVAAKLNEHDDKNIRQVANRPNNASLETCSGLIKGDGSCKGKNLVKMDDEANLVKELAFEFMNKKCPRVRKNVLCPVEQFDAETEFQFIAYCVQNSLFDQLCEFLDPKEDPEEEEEFPDFVFGKDPDGKEKEEDEESDESECSDGWEKVKRKRKKKRKERKDCKERNDGKENEGEKEGVKCNNAVKRISFDVNIRVVNGDGSVVTKSDNFSDKVNNNIITKLDTGKAMAVTVDTLNKRIKELEGIIKKKDKLIRQLQSSDAPRKWGSGNGSGLGQGANRGQSPRAPKGPILKNKDQLGKEVEVMKEVMPEVVTNNMKDAELRSLEESRAGDVRSSVTMMLKKNLNLERRITEDQEKMKRNKEVVARTEKYLGSGGR